MRGLRMIWLRGLVPLLLAFVATTGCSTLLAVKGEQRRADALSIVTGTVAAEAPPRGPLVVAILTGSGDDAALVDYFVASEPGPWGFAVPAGSYWIAAFEDANRDGAYQDEPFYRSDPDHPLVLAAGQRRDDVDIVIPRAGRALRKGLLTLSSLIARSDAEQRTKSIYALSAVGTVTTLDDPRFDSAVAEKGMWQYYDFVVGGRAGIYFLEPYDPKRIPVLFVHGIGGTPRNFATLIAALDRRRFQPWVLYYPSGGSLERIVPWVAQLFTRLETQLHFGEAVVVAHSMGGLVARGFVLHHAEVDGSPTIRTFVTIASPLGGMASAGEGVEKSPVVIRSWYGLAPGSAYLDGLFYTDPEHRTQRRRLPADIAYHLFFGFGGGGRSGSSDGVVSVASQLRPEAQEEARSLRGFDATHTGILESPAVAARLNEILAERR